MKIRMYPNRLQKSIMRGWLGCARKVYNMVVEDYRAGRRDGQKYYREELKRRQLNQWAFMKASKVPYNLLDDVIEEALHSRTEVLRRNAAGDGVHTMSFRALKDPRQSFIVRQANTVAPLQFYPQSLHARLVTSPDTVRRRHKDHNLSHRTDPDSMRKRLVPFHPEHLSLNNNNWPNLEGTTQYDSKVLYERKLRRWSFCWVYGKEAPPGDDNQVAFTTNIAAIDPGVVNFVTWYSPLLGAGHIGHRDINKIIRLCLRLDRLIGATSQARGRRKSSHRRAQARVRKRIRNLIDEIHRKTIRFLVDTFDIIVIPKFGATQMSVRKPGRRLAKKTVRGMLGWAHGRFRVALISKAEELGVRVVTDFSEAYTSRTCSTCGWEHPRLGGRREFICGGCGLLIDRDVNGAKGVLLRSVREGRLVAKIHA